MIAYGLRPRLTNLDTRKYFMPALTAKFIGAIALGVIYQFYYGGGDTFTFHTHGSSWIWKACITDPLIGLKLFFTKSGGYTGENYKYVGHIWMFRDESSWVIIRIAALFDTFTLSTYSATALFFAFFSFTGAWAMFLAFTKIYPGKHKVIAISILFMPSVIFWGSGILKDTITLGSLSWLTYFLFEISMHKKYSVTNVLFLVLFAWIIFSIKIYILLCFLVAASAYLIYAYKEKIKNTAFKIIMMPILVLFFGGGGLFILQKISETNSRYALDKLTHTAYITAYDIRYGWGARHGPNSGYDLGMTDASLGSFISLAPKGIAVTLFRPFLWEARNPLMLLSAIEALIITILTIRIFVLSSWSQFMRFVSSPTGIYCLSFSLLFAFAVGVSTGNFGTLMRYKIPVIPMYMVFLLLVPTKKEAAKEKLLTNTGSGSRTPQ